MLHLLIFITDCKSEKNGYEGNLLSLLNHYGILGGLFFTAIFVVSGALWVMIKTTGEVSDRAYKIARPFSMAMLSF